MDNCISHNDCAENSVEIAFYADRHVDAHDALDKGYMGLNVFYAGQHVVECKDFFLAECHALVSDEPLFVAAVSDSDGAGGNPPIRCTQ